MHRSRIYYRDGGAVLKVGGLVLVTDLRAPKARVSRGVRGYAPPGNFEIENARDAISSILSDFDNDFWTFFILFLLS